MQFLTAKAQGIGLLVHAEKALVVAKDVATTKFRGLGELGLDIWEGVFPFVLGQFYAWVGFYFKKGRIHFGEFVPGKTP